MAINIGLKSFEPSEKIPILSSREQLKRVYCSCE